MTFITISDFDLTLSVSHSFKQHSIRSYGEDTQEIYMAGKTYAQTNLRKGILEKFAKHGSSYFSAIATHHNNPFFIAGFMSVLLKKELTWVADFEDPESETAIKEYKIAGEEKPFFISYIPKSGAEFNRVSKSLNGKIEQIEAIHRILLERELIKEDSIVNFYDDMRANYDAAVCYELEETVKGKQVKLNAYLVNPGNKGEFQILCQLVNHKEESKSLSALDAVSRPVNSFRFFPAVEVAKEELNIPSQGQWSMDKEYELLP